MLGQSTLSRAGIYCTEGTVLAVVWKLYNVRGDAEKLRMPSSVTKNDHVLRIKNECKLWTYKSRHVSDLWIMRIGNEPLDH